MNLLAANLGSPRSVAVYVLPPILYVACSDRLIAVAGSLGGVRETSTGGRGCRRAVHAAARARAAQHRARPSPVGPGRDTAARGVAGKEDRQRVPDQALESRAAVVAGALIAGSTAQPDGIRGAAQAAAAFAVELAAGKVPSIRRIRDQLGCGQARAAAVQQALRAEVTR